MARNKLVGNVTALMFKRVFDWRLRTERAVRPQRDRETETGDVVFVSSCGHLAVIIMRTGGRHLTFLVGYDCNLFKVLRKKNPTTITTNCQQLMRIKLCKLTGRVT